jgi:hypothetical protein
MCAYRPALVREIDYSPAKPSSEKVVAKYVRWTFSGCQSGT